MLHLYHPAALWTLAALALPLAIHLRRPPPRTVRLGSLHFLKNAARRPLRHLRWRELLLLCTRLGLLAALSFLLAGSHWLVRPPSGPRHWALLDPTAALTGESLTHWQEARANGEEPRRLVPGFPLASDASSPGADAPDLWSLLREADAQFPDGSTLDVFSPVRLAALRGIRPALVHCKLRWFQTPDDAGDILHVWNAERAVEGRSDAHSTVFTASSSDLNVLPAISVLILHDAESTADARYVEAAVHTATDAARRTVNVQNRDITPDAENAATADWMFWLSTQPVPEALARRAPRIVRYVGEGAAATSDRIVAPSGSPVDGVSLWKRAPAPATGTVLWRDGQGNPVLTYARQTAGERWDFHARFDPAWTDLPRTTALPGWMRTLLFPVNATLPDADPAHDRRLADPSMGLPSEVPATAAIPTLAPDGLPARDLHWLLWALAALFFVIERVLSLRRSPEPTAAAR